MQINTKDAYARGISDGNTVLIETETGFIETIVELTDKVMPGVVSFPFGWNGPQPAALQKVLNKYPGVNVNNITDQSRIDPLSAMTAFNGTRVKVTRV